MNAAHVTCTDMGPWCGCEITRAKWNAILRLLASVWSKGEQGRAPRTPVPIRSGMSFFYFNPEGFKYLTTAATQTYEVLCDLQPIGALVSCIRSAAASVGNAMTSIVTFLAEAPINMRKRILGKMSADARSASTRITSTRGTAITREPTAAAEAQIEDAEMGQVGVDMPKA